MEDTARVVTDGKFDYLYAFVFDGHSGAAASAWLEEHMYDAVCEALVDDLAAPIEPKPDGVICPINLKAQLSQSFKRADHALIQHLSGLTADESLAGSTATVGLVRADAVTVANVGDSRAVLCRKGRALDLSMEHRVYGRNPVVKEEVARIEAGGGWVKNGRVCDVLSVSRAFGDAMFKGKGLPTLLKYGVSEGFWDEAFSKSVHFTHDPISCLPDVYQAALTQDDEFLIIATDGLWDVFTSEQAVQQTRKELLKGASAQEVADKLVAWAVKRYTADNVAVVVVDFGTAARRQGSSHGKAKSKKGGGLFGKLFG